MNEREEVEAAAAEFKVCDGPNRMGCACLGRCLGSHLAVIRKKYDADHEGEKSWWSDQGHCWLKKRPGDSGRAGAPLTAENYWTGVN